MTNKDNLPEKQPERLPAPDHPDYGAGQRKRVTFLPDPIAGMGFTLRSLFKSNPTKEYPEERLETAPRYHGRHQLNRHPDGLEKCVGCELCAWACPADAIFVEGADNDDTPEEEGGTGRFSAGERYGQTYQINYLRCIFCGLCIEACPTRALTMTNEYELVDDNRGDLIFTKEQLLAPLEDHMAQPPHPMVEDTAVDAYWRGEVTAATPEQLAFARKREEKQKGEQA